MQPYLGEIRMFAGNFAPQGWAFCNGQLMAIADNTALYSLLGTTYGGDGQTTFALPDLQGRIPVHLGNSYNLGQNGGAETVTLTVNQMPSHTHSVNAQSENGMVGNPTNAVWASSSIKPYGTGTPNELMSASAISAVGGSQPHENMMPFACISFIISLEGVYPSQN